jgi:ankyrin repeat protein
MKMQLLPWSWGNTALHYACKYNRAEILKVLMPYVANVDITLVVNSVSLSLVCLACLQSWLISCQ